MTRTRLRPECADCGHHRSIHAYDPADEGRHEPRRCGIPSCHCNVYRRPAKGERVKRTP